MPTDPTPKRDFLAQFFDYAHLPEEKQAVSKPFGDLAQRLLETLPSNPERTVALRKLLEAKDCAVRASFAKMGLMLAAILSIAFYAAPAFAQGTPPAPGGIGSLLSGFLTVPNVAGAVVAVLGLVGGFQFFTSRRKLAVSTAIFYAFHVTEDIHDQLDDGPIKDGFDKAANALKVADAYLRKTGWRGLKPGDETDAAAIQLQAIHGGEVAKEKLVVAQAEATVAAQAAVPKAA